MGKKASIIATVLLVGVLCALVMAMRADHSAQTARLAQANTTIQALQAERAQLQQRLSTMEAQETFTDETDDNRPEDQEVKEETNVLLCLNATDDSFFEEVYPDLQAAGLVGTILFRDGRMPGDNYEMSTADFLELIHSGWNYAITLDREQDQSVDDWLEAVADYQERLQRRVAVQPTGYCFGTDAYDSEVLEGLKGLGFTEVFYHQGEVSTETDGLRQICLVDFQTDLHTARQDGLNGYVGLEVWMSWIDDTPESLRYEPERMQGLLSDPQLHFQGPSELQRNEPVAEEEDQKEPEESEQTTEAQDAESIRARITEIDRLIQEEYTKFGE